MALPAFASVVHPGEGVPGVDALQRRLVALGDLPAGTVAATGSDRIPRRARRCRQTVSASPRTGTGRHHRPKHTRRVAHPDRDACPSDRARARAPPLAAAPGRTAPRRDQHPDVPPVGLGRDSAERRLFGMDVIVGRALHYQTPVFVEQLQEVIFRPYWNVPSSIVEARDSAAYRSRSGVSAPRADGDRARTRRRCAGRRGNAGEPGEAPAKEPFRLRQRPGPQNALGLVKLVFPNAENVYMHGTPGKRSVPESSISR